MKSFVSLSLAALVVASAACARAADFASGIAVGDGVPTYTSEKCGGAEDGVQVGQKLCYT
ncbi:MAG: hypothetical protein DCC68_20790 [Planctomycetota bacterium]|nr:MAG: hypothetical protein DCC68_20790 [Planctomycetota bacterium]